MNAPQEQKVCSTPLKILGTNGDLSRRPITTDVGRILGKVNGCLSEMTRQGFVKIPHFKPSSNKIRNVFPRTSRGLEEKARLTAAFLQRKLRGNGDDPSSMTEIPFLKLRGRRGYPESSLRLID